MLTSYILNVTIKFGTLSGIIYVCLPPPSPASIRSCLFTRGSYLLSFVNINIIVVVVCVVVVVVVVVVIVLGLPGLGVLSLT